MKELTTQTGIIVKCSKTAIEFFQNAQSVDSFSVLELPEEFHACIIEQAEFEAIWETHAYDGALKESGGF